MKTSQHDVTMDDPDIQRESEFSGASRIILLITLLFVLFGVWAWFGTLDEVSTGTGKVVPSSREQILQSLDGGIVTELLVHEGDKVPGRANRRPPRPDPLRVQRRGKHGALPRLSGLQRAALRGSERPAAEVPGLAQSVPGPDRLRNTAV